MLLNIFTFLVRGASIFFRAIAPRACRFHPSCSEYAVEALKTFGVWKGSFMAFKRILRCHPYSDGGYDPVKRSPNFEVRNSAQFLK